MMTAAFEGKLFECRFQWPPTSNAGCGQMVRFSVKASPESSVEISFNSFPRPPARVKLTYVAGAISAEKDLVPQYQPQEKPPDSCGPPCAVARETWMIP